MKTIITIWLCSASVPDCTPAQDPTGPAAVIEQPISNAECEERFKSALVLALAESENSQGYIARHTCVSGQAL